MVRPKEEKRKRKQTTVEFKQAQESLAGIEWAQDYFDRKFNQEYEWESPDDKIEYFRARRRNSRWNILFRLAPDLRCPKCKELRVKSREWVIYNKIGPRGGKKVAVKCRSCYWVDLYNPDGEKPKQPVRLPDTIFQVAEVRFTIDRIALRKAIAKMGISGSAFARLAGWSRGWQRKLEDGMVKTVNDKTMSKVLNLLVNALVFPEDTEDFFKELEEKGAFEDKKQG